MMKRELLLLLALLLCLPLALATEDLAFPMQVQDTSGEIVTSPISLEYNLYYVSSGGSAFHTESETVTPDSNGVVTVSLSDVSANWSQDIFFGVTIGSNSEAVPRIQLTSAPDSANNPFNYDETVNIASAKNSSTKFAWGATSVTSGFEYEFVGDVRATNLNVSGDICVEGGNCLTGLTTDHGSLTGLGDDDHPQYVLNTGETSNVNLNNKNLTNVSVFAFNGGQNLVWNSDYYTVDVPSGLGNTVQVGQELTLMRKNAAGQKIYAGQIVYESGVSGEMITVDLADASNSSKIGSLGMVTIPSCNNNAVCPVTYFGAVHNLDTSAFSGGDILYLSADGSGNVTDTLPGGNNYHITIGRVSRSHASSGIISFKESLDFADEPVFANFKVLNNLTIDTNTLTIDSTANTVDVLTLNTGQGDNELYAMDQDVQTTDAVTFDAGTFSSDLTVDTNTLFVDSDNDAVIIGDTSLPYPAVSYKLNVVSDDLTAVFTADQPMDSLSGRVFAIGTANEDFVRTVFYSNSFIGFGGGSSTRDAYLGWDSSNTLKIGSNFDGTGSGNLLITGFLNATTLNTGQGDNELYAMNQDVQTTSDVTFNSEYMSGSGTAGSPFLQFGDANTGIYRESTDTFSVSVSGSELVDFDPGLVNISGDLEINQTINQTLVDGNVREFSNGCYEKVNSTGVYMIC